MGFRALLHRLFGGTLARREVAPAGKSDDLEESLTRIVARLAPRGLLLSHQHVGGWRPGDSRRHFAVAWLKAHGFTVDREDGAAEGAEAMRVAVLGFSSG